MFEVFKKYINEKVVLLDADWDFIAPLCKTKELRKQQYLLQEGEIWRYNAFVCSGCLRRYTIDDEGIEHILQFSVENWWAGDRESLVNGTASKYTIDAVEDSVVLIIKKGDFEIICKHIPAFNELMNNILKGSFNALQERVHAAISYTAEEKYLDFLQAYPGLANRVPRHMLASYLGMTPETLNRIRNQVSGK